MEGICNQALSVFKIFAMSPTNIFSLPKDSGQNFSLIRKLLFGGSGKVNRWALVGREGRPEDRFLTALVLSTGILPISGPLL